MHGWGSAENYPKAYFNNHVYFVCFRDNESNGDVDKNYRNCMILKIKVGHTYLCMHGHSYLWLCALYRHDLGVESNIFENRNIIYMLN